MKNFFNSKKACLAKLKQSEMRSGGFSMIELLIVITIIGLLSTVVLSSVSQARAKAYDAKVKQQLSGFRTAAEVYYSNQEPNSYGPASISCSLGMFNDTSPSNASPALFIVSENMPSTTQIVCASTNTAYAVKATLYSGTEYFCIDNRGAARVISGEIGGPITACP